MLLTTASTSASTSSQSTYPSSTTLETLPQLLLLISDRSGERAIALENDTYSIGRSNSNDIRLFDTHVSRSHARLEAFTSKPGDRRYLLSDEGVHSASASRNGTYINSEPIQIRLLKIGDDISFGPNVKARLETRERLGDSIARTLLAVGDRIKQSSPAKQSSNKPTDLQHLN